MDIECAICYQKAIHPIEIPCKHVYCYLCIKGVAARNRKCPLCRSDVKMENLINPKLMEPQFNSSY